MTPTDAWIVIGLLAACIGFLATSLALIAMLNRAFTHAWNAGLTAAERHLDTCLTQALQVPLQAPAHGDTQLEAEHQQLIHDARHR